MIIKHFTAGEYETNNYLLICEETKEAALIDAGGNYETTVKLLKENNASLKYILHTHGHFDHIQGDVPLQKEFGAKVLIHKGDEFLVAALKQQLVLHGMKPVEPPVIDEFLEDGQEISVGNIKLKIIHTPGHSQGGVCFLTDKHLFCGDTLFQDNVGRTDLPGGSYKILGDSIKNKIFTLDEDITAYPGHGDFTTIGHEKENNPYFGKRAAR
jgi:glyoxylase-like metal-dependent hydrolase (beta-lactamase superfamily II)